MVDKANLELGAERGSPKMLEGTGLRFAHTMALAPTASNALICGNVSPTIEPWRANAFRQDTMSGTFIQKNRYLDQLIRKKAEAGELDYDETWIKIVQEEGSIQVIDGFTELEKEVFKTAPEIDMLWAVEHTADRQPEIDQGQSFNIFIRPDISIKRLHAIHFSAWKKGVKTMYYVRSEKLANTEKVSQKVIRKRIEDDIDLAAIINDEECLACHG
jgi:ribonucleoside-diphosphate reductase alpha chain